MVPVQNSQSVRVSTLHRKSVPKPPVPTIALRILLVHSYIVQKMVANRVETEAARHAKLNIKCCSVISILATNHSHALSYDGADTVQTRTNQGWKPEHRPFILECWSLEGRPFLGDVNSGIHSLSSLLTCRHCYLHDLWIVLFCC
jgi:hypothetical protein